MWGVRYTFQTSDSCIFHRLPTGIPHRLTRRAGLKQGQADVLCPMAWLSALFHLQGGRWWQMDSWLSQDEGIQRAELTLGMMTAPRGEGAGYLETIWKAGKHLREEDWRRGMRLPGASSSVEAKTPWVTLVLLSIWRTRSGILRALWGSWRAVIVGLGN